MKKSLTFNGYSITKHDSQLINEIKEELTVTPSSGLDFNEKKEYTLYRENTNKLYIPRYFGLQRFGLPERDLILNTGIDCNRLEFEGNLRDEQIEVVNKFLQVAYDPLKRGGIINVGCGFGKTVVALYIACQIKKKTLFIVHKDFLGTQFAERAKLFVPKAKIGIIKQNKVDIEDKDLVTGSLQSLAMRDYNEDMLKEFGLVIVDECHHTSAEVFSNALLKMASPIMMGLSATLNRKDGLRKVFEWFLGKPILKMKSKKDNTVNIKIEYYYDDNENYNKEVKMWNGKISSVHMINNICSYEPRNIHITNIINEILEKENNRQILILSERRNQLETLNKLLKDKYTTGYYIGGLSREKLSESEKKQIILGTYHMASEGMDIPSLNTLILASPISSIEQSIGRIQRKKPEDREYNPLCIDIVDTFSMFESKGKTRMRYYKSRQYNVINEKKESKEIKYNYIEEE
jgi:superfamily II DNA or RNA helicase